MPLTELDGRLTVEGENILVRAFARGFCAAPIRAGEAEQQADNEIVRAAQALDAEQA